MAKRHADAIMTLSAPELEQAVDLVQKHHPDERVVKLQVGQDVFWMKQSERHQTVKNRIKKGNGDQALLRERDNLIDLAEKGIPVPRVVSSTDDYLVIADCGLTLNDMLFSPDYSTEEGERAFFETGRALARLHARGYALGRVKANDFCWDGKTVRFIDIEKTPAALNPKTNGRMNLVKFVFNTFYLTYKLQHDANPEAKAFLLGYASEPTSEVQQTIEATRKWCVRRWWMAALSIPIGFLRPLGRASDFKATAPTLMLFAYHSYANLTKGAASDPARNDG